LRILPTYLIPGSLRFKYIERLFRVVDLLHLNGLSLPIELLRKFKNLDKLVLFVLHAAPLSRDTYSALNEVAELYIAPSHFALSVEMPKIGRPTMVMHYGIDVEEFKPIPKPLARAKLNLPEDRGIILWNDRISPEKDLETFLRAYLAIYHELVE